MTAAEVALTVVVEAVAGPGQADRLRTALEALVEPSLEEAGCLAFRPYLDPNDASHMVVVEQWADQAALDAHFDSPHVAHAARVFELVLAEPLTVRLYTDS